MLVDDAVAATVREVYFLVDTFFLIVKVQFSYSTISKESSLSVIVVDGGQGGGVEMRFVGF